MAEYIDKKDLEEYIELGYSARQILSLFDEGECPYADVVERDEYEKLKKENVELKIKYDDAEKRCCHAMDRNAKLRSKIDEARAEILKNIYKYSGSGNEVTQAYCDGFKDSLEIVVRNMGE